MANLAAVDVGSNGIRMIVSRLDAAGKLETLENLRLPVRLGQEAFTAGQFSEKTMQMAVDAFLRFRQIADHFEVSQTRAVATSAMREAANSDLLIDRIARETGINIEIISGEEEAMLIFMAVQHAVNLHDKTALLVDIGGGSVEVTLSYGEQILSTESLGMGTVRMLSKLEAQSDQALSSSRLMQEFAASAHRYISQEVGDQKIDICVGTGGNLEEMGRLRRRLLDKQRGDMVTVDDLGKLIEYLGALSVEERMRKLELNPDRADVIMPAMIVMHMIAHQARVKEIQVPGVGLKDGVVLEMAPLALGPLLPRRVQVMASVERMGRKYGYDAEHAAITGRLAARLFDQTLSLHHLTENERLLLEAAAMLHDIGHFINTVDHDRHGYYLLMNHPLIGLAPLEQEIVANLVYFHSKHAPSASDPNVRALAQKDRIIVTRLSALLRLADSLDISHQARVHDVFLEQYQSGQWRLHLVSQSEAMLEKWSLGKRKTLFQEVFGVKLEVM